MKFTCIKALTTHIVCFEGMNKVTFNNYDISEMDIDGLKVGLCKMPKSVETLIIPDKDFFAFKTQSVYLRMMDIFKELPAHIKTVKMDVSMINKLSSDEQKAIMSIRSDLNIIVVDFEKYSKHYPSVLIRSDGKKMEPMAANPKKLVPTNTG